MIWDFLHQCSFVLTKIPLRNISLAKSMCVCVHDYLPGVNCQKWNCFVFLSYRFVLPMAAPGNVLVLILTGDLSVRLSIHAFILPTVVNMCSSSRWQWWVFYCATMSIFGNRGFIWDLCFFLPNALFFCPISPLRFLMFFFFCINIQKLCLYIAAPKFSQFIVNVLIFLNTFWYLQCNIFIRSNIPIFSFLDFFFFLVSSSHRFPYPHMVQIFL